MCFVIATQCKNSYVNTLAFNSFYLNFLAVIVTGMLILGGAAVVNALSGMNIYAASFLIPLAAAPFTMSGVFSM
jgi:hypothetical protein